MNNEIPNLVDSAVAEMAKCEAELVAQILAENLTPSGIQSIAEQAAEFAETAASQIAGSAFKASCKAGCNWCCYQPVRVTPPEVFRIVRFIRSLPVKTQDQLTSQIRESVRPAMAQNTDIQNKAGTPCPFLDTSSSNAGSANTGLCGIYAVRPLACAEFNSNNVKDCKKGSQKGFQATMVTRERSRVLIYKAVQQGLMRGLTQALPDVENSVFNLANAVLIALENPDTEAAWLKGLPVFTQET